MTENPLAEPLRRCLAALSDDYASYNDPVLLRREDNVDWGWNLRIMRDAMAALVEHGQAPFRVEQRCTSEALSTLEDDLMPRAAKDRLKEAKRRAKAQEEMTWPDGADLYNPSAPEVEEKRGKAT